MSNDPSKRRPLPPLDECYRLWTYNPDTGVLTHNKKRGVKEGTVAGKPTEAGYLRITRTPNKEKRPGLRQGFTLYVARLVYYMHHGVDPGELEIDHINGVRDDNRISNLRLVTRLENEQNKHP
jgi:hypothetical protein